MGSRDGLKCETGALFSLCPFAHKASCVAAVKGRRGKKGSAAAWLAYANPIELGGNHSTPLEQATVAGENIHAHGDLLLCGKIDKPKYPRVQSSFEEDQCSKVLIQGDQHAAVLMCSVQNLIVARIPTPISNPDDVMAGFQQGLPDPTPNARVQ